MGTGTGQGLEYLAFLGEGRSQFPFFHNLSRAGTSRSRSRFRAAAISRSRIAVNRSRYS
jgi:hypothetical protein